MSVSKSPLIVALTGPIGSGVTTLSHVLKQHNFHRVSLSELIKEVYRKRHGLEAGAPIPFTPGQRKELQDIGDEGREKSLSHWLEVALEGLPSERDVVIDCVRNTGEIEAIRDRFTKSYVVAVVANRTARWDRSKSNYGTEGEFAEADERDNEDKDERPYGQQVSRCVNAADYVLTNDAPLGSSGNVNKGLWEKISTDLDVMRGIAPRRPRDEETHMATAYTASHLSLCLKRKVGCVIVGADSLPLSTGFNENPLGTQPCVREWGYCFKDDAMEKELEERKESHCTKCGAINHFPGGGWRCAGCKDSLKKQLFPSRNMEKCTAIHAEERAIRSLGDRSAKGGTMYMTTFPCLQCSRYILDAGIKKIVYVEAYPVKEARELLERFRVEFVPFNGFKARAFNIVFRSGT